MKLRIKKVIAGNQEISTLQYRTSHMSKWEDVPVVIFKPGEEDDKAWGKCTRNSGA